MRKHFRQYLIPAAVFTGLGLSVAAFAQESPGPGDGSRPAHEAGAPHGHRHGHRGPRGDRFMRQVRKLDLSEQQKNTIKGFFEARKDQFRSGFENLRTQRRAFDTATPGTKAYTDAAAQLADIEANQARTRVHEQAEMRSKVYAVLSDTQKTKLGAELAKTPEKSPLQDKR